MRLRFDSISLVMTVLALVLAGCARSDQTAGAGSSNETGAAQSSVARDGSGERDPCSLLDPKEVEAVMGPLAGAPYRSRDDPEDQVPAEHGEACVYETPDFRTIRVSATWENGATLLKVISLPGRIVNATPTDAPEVQAASKMLPGGVPMSGEWDEAMTVGCCQILALRGDTLVKFDFGGWRDDLRSAAALLDKALVRIDQPLSIDGRAGNAAASKRAALRPAKREACSLLTRAEAEAIVGPLLADPRPTAGSEACVYRFTQSAGSQSPMQDAPEQLKSLMSGLTGGRSGMVGGPVDATLSVYWRGGFHKLRENALVAGGTMSAMQGIPGMPKRQGGAVEGGPWDEALQTGLGFTAVKKDVAVSIDTEPMLTAEQVELRRRLVAKAIEKI